MLYLQIRNIGKFTSLLFSDDSFDRFLLHDASFETSFTTIVEGRKNEDFFTEEEKEKELAESFIRWSQIRPSAYKLLQGKKLPVSFKVILLTAPAVTKNMVEKSGFSGCPVSSLSVSAVYREQKLLLRTGVSYSGFSMDRSLEKYWDESVLKFLQDREIECAEPEE
ncbi:MAG: hypothetical protein IKS18_03440 [Lachnospiraceae bacterium]|nr:hypothetical protein [Lachnospiraceae bacterium]